MTWHSTSLRISSWFPTPNSLWYNSTMKKRKIMWNCPTCGFAQYKNKTVCYNCAYRKPRIKRAPKQLELKWTK